MPIISRACRCSRVCGCGQISAADTKSSAPSIMLAPHSIVAMRLSCPGASTSEILRKGFASFPHFGHFGCTTYASEPSQVWHW